MYSELMLNVAVVSYVAQLAVQLATQAVSLQHQGSVGGYTDDSTWYLDILTYS